MTRAGAALQRMLQVRGRERERYRALNTRGRHLLVEYTGCDACVLDDLKSVEMLMCEAAVAAGTRIVASVLQPFEPQGVTGVVVVEESHLSIHTWPEHGYAAVDFFTCGSGTPEGAHQVLMAGLKATRAEKIYVERGMGGTGPGMAMRSHVVELREEGVCAPTCTVTAS